ncbi:selenium cofactor biosynthesis protein YqeC [Clostridium perfringens]|uniref:selenium cofactor biosynthesis protein YqeC n=1 Tax=Clostridium perfringens TaxID=1502 RepID=UPI00177DF1ED|nr:selenium cofactor biosynthesis protein YqeC [Clostridium perfringens]MDU7726178.1 selenium cofactor biosynthesis protein YqeC [Clostridium perfringens]BDA28682.1 hydroxylase accessory protein YqeC [Clostridium perfringens]HCG3173059.1 putative selenium-dependent hydroxylase accessory protein YqeC [Clostridium perfringens]
MKNSLSDLIDIKIGDIISVVGSGGKTTFIYNLAKEIKNKKILISSTTKMLYPEENQVDYFFCLAEDNEISIKEGRTFIGGEKVSKNKISGDISLIKKYISRFDYILLECDGSKTKPLKGWNSTEPVILNETTKTIGIIPLHIVGEKITEKNIHRIEIFNNVFKTKIGDEITLNVIAEIITNPKGLFKDAVGEKILFLNRINNKKSKELVWKLLEILSRKNKNSLKIIGGDLKKNKYYEF